MNAIDELKGKYNSGTISQTEFFLIGVLLFCIGIIIGMLFSPKGYRAYGSNNKNNGNNNGTPVDELKN